MNFIDLCLLQPNLGLKIANFGPQYCHNPYMKIKELPITRSCVNSNLTVREVAKVFEQHQDWAGVILVQDCRFMGMLSRHTCFEVLGKPFGIEIYSKKTILEFCTSYEPYNLVLDANTSVQDAVKFALNRQNVAIFEPIVVHLEDNTYALLNMHILLLNQCDLLEGLYSEVHQLSIIDPLTNLYNRRGFFEMAQQAVIESQTTQVTLSALMIDIDNFKNTNDRYGHFMGDLVLQAVADELQRTLREKDLLGRFGGEEFIALLPNTSLETACSIAERLRFNVGSRVVQFNEEKTSVTISVGICHIKNEKVSLDSLLTRADQAMYEAKMIGKNRIKVWSGDVDPVHANMAIQNYRQPACPENNSTSAAIDPAAIFDATIEGWVKTLEMRDKQMEDHAQRVVSMTVAFAKRLGITGQDLEDIRRGALLHDVGKIALPDEVLFKPGPLNEEEWEIMRKHPAYAYDLLSPIPFLQKSLDIPYCHHERWDGTGYPRGLKGEEIPLSARIFTIVDVWDALCSARCYRPAWQPEEIIEYIAENSGQIFDPALTPVFINILQEQLVQA